MNDTKPRFSQMVTERHQSMTPEERLQAASDMFDTARAIVESSLPVGMTRHERRLALVRRIYGDELPPAAQEAFARHGAGSDLRITCPPSKAAPMHSPTMRNPG